MKRIGILVLFVMLSVSSIAQDPSPRLLTASVSGGVALVATAAAAATGPWWSALIGLVSQFLSAFSGGKVNSKAAQTAVTSNADNLNQALTYLQAWPTLLDQSQQLRQDAIELGQMVSQLATSPDDITDDQWSDFNQQVKAVQSEYKSIYGNQTNVQILENASEYHLTMQNANQAWNNVNKMMARSNKSSAERKASLGSVNGSTAAITAASLLPEWWAIEEAQLLATQYKNVAAQAKSAQGGKSASPSTGSSPQPSTSSAVLLRKRSVEPRLLSIGFSRPSDRLSLVAVQTASSERLVDNEQQTLSGRATDLNRVPSWMTTSLTQTRQQYRTNWYQTLGGGLVGAVLGFICMLFLPAFARIALTPRHALEMNLLQNSLSFHSDERNVLADQLGALHLDVLNYVWSGGPIEKLEPSEVPQRPTPSDERLGRIQNLRHMLREGRLNSSN